MRTTITILSLAALVASPASAADDQKQRPRKAWLHGYVSRPDPGSVVTPPDLLKSIQPPPERPTEGSSLSDYLVRDPADHEPGYLPNSPAIQAVRQVLMQRRPTPHARVLFFDPLKTDPFVVDGRATIHGWYVNIEDVKLLKGGGWDAKITVGARLHPRHHPFRHDVMEQFEEWYRCQNGRLHYLGGRPSPLNQPDAVPHIRRTL